MTIRSSYGLRRTKDCPCLHVTTGIGHLYRDYHGTQPFQHSDSLQHTCHHLRIGISRNVFFVQADSESTDTLVDSLQHVGHQHSEDDILMESLRDAAGGGHPDTVGVYQHLHHRHRMVVEGSDGASEQLEEVSAANEAQLQNFLKANPELLPIEELELPGPMMVVGAETHVNSGAIDLVGITPTADILLIEFKTGPQNPDFRQALAQLLDYGSDVWAMSFQDFEDRAVGYFRGGRCRDPRTKGQTSLLDATKGAKRDLGIECPSCCSELYLHLHQTDSPNFPCNRPSPRSGPGP